MLNKLDELKATILNNKFKCTKSSRQWYGAGVIVSSQPTRQERIFEGHPFKKFIIVRLKNPRRLVTLMFYLRDICGLFIATNKFAFYGDIIAGTANRYVKKYGDPGPAQKEMLLMIVEKVSKLVHKNGLIFIQHRIKFIDKHTANWVHSSSKHIS